MRRSKVATKWQRRPAAVPSRAEQSRDGSATLPTTSECTALRDSQESALEFVTPSVSIIPEPLVVVVETSAKHRATLDVAEPTIGCRFSWRNGGLGLNSVGFSNRVGAASPSERAAHPWNDSPLPGSVSMLHPTVVHPNSSGVRPSIL